jgi:hypothetical protein
MNTLRSGGWSKVPMHFLSRYYMVSGQNHVLTTLPDVKEFLLYPDHLKTELEPSSKMQWL